MSKNTQSSLTPNTQTQQPHKSMPYMAYERQQHITRLCIRCGLLLMQYGAESVTVVDLTQRLGIALGVAEVECTLSFNGIILTTIYNGRCITTTRGTIRQSINVHLLVQIQRIISTVESKRVDESLIKKTQIAFDNLDSAAYPLWMVCLFVGGSCAGFACLNGASMTINIVTFIAGAIAMFMRIQLSKRHLNTFVTVILTAFIASLIGATTYFIQDAYGLGNDPTIAMASSVILLIPSFPMINALSDILKGYVNMGVGRTVYTLMLVLSSCVGIVMALVLLHIDSWGV